jgi:glutathione S-transferase
VRYLGNPAEYAEALAGKCGPGYAALDVMEDHLASRPFFVGARYTIADIALYAYTYVAHEGGFDLSRYKSVNSWLERVRNQRDHIHMEPVSE